MQLQASNLPIRMARAGAFLAGEGGSAAGHIISFFQIAEAVNDIVVVTTADIEPPGPMILYANPSFTRLTGYTAAEVIGRSPGFLRGPGTSRATLDRIRAALQAGRDVHEKLLTYAKNGAPCWLDLRISPLCDAAGSITHFAAIARDVTLDRRQPDEIEVMADRDTLTGIGNRRALLRRIEAEIERVQARPAARTDPRGLCVAFIEVDRFGQVNDTHGPRIGDAVLFDIADRLVENLRRSDLVGRLCGEAFAVTMPDVTLREAKLQAERLRRCVAAAPFETPSGPLPMTVSIGVAAFDRGDSLVSLMARADTAMQADKRNGCDHVTVEGLVPTA